MATVRLSNKLRSEICDCASNSFKNRIAAASDKRHEAEESVGLTAYRFKYSAHKKIMESLPDGALPHSNSIKVEIERENSSNISGTFSLGNPLPQFYENCGNGYHHRDAPVKIFEDKVLEYCQLTDKYREIVKTRDQSVSNIRSVLESCNTIKQFLEAFPAGESLLPNHVLGKMQETPEKRSNTKFVAPEVADDLKKQLLINRVTA